MKTNRTWEQCLQAWVSYKENLRTQGNAGAHIYEQICKGIRWPMIGVCLSVKEYQRFTREGHNLDQIMGYCESGSQIHDHVRMYKNTGIEHTLGLSTPRKGFYAVIGINGGDLICYYNHDQGDDFLPEEVVINRSPLFNKASQGPTYDDIKVGDIIQVDDTKLVERTWNGSSYTTYSVTWRFYNR
jgi:hypothetical protein